MKVSDFTFKDSEGVEIFTYKWEPDVSAAKGIVQIIHGISEHARRYEHFAEVLTDAGYIVYAHDHRGHGRTAAKTDLLGHAGVDGWNWIVKDIIELTKIIREQQPNLPLFIFGHSMGSFALRQVMYENNDLWNIKGFILSGTGGSSTFMLIFGKFLCKQIIRRHGRNKISELISGLSFYNFNAKCPEKRTPFDWLSRDQDEVNKYIRDPLCGQTCSAGFYYDFFNGILAVQNLLNVERLPKSVPILIFSGEMDPVGRYGKVVTKLVNIYQRSGIQDITFKLYEGGRHEMLNEINREKVISDILMWIGSKNK
ncbi:MAG: lysophospholipase [Clostridia bacterium]|nr:lysophospholipase [Clostridia bacterium]